MITRKERLILKNLNGNTFVSSKELESVLSVSNKTARKMVSQLNDTLSKYGAVIVSKVGKGYRLEVNDEKTFKELLDDNEIDPFLDSEPGVDYLVEVFLNSDGHIKASDLSEKLYISQKIVSSAIKKAEEILRYYNLRLERKPHYGMKLRGTEYDIRRCLSAMLRSAGSPHIDSAIETIVNYLFARHNIIMSTVAKETFLIYVQVSVLRQRQGKPLTLTPELLRFTEEAQYQSIYDAARECASLLEDEYNICFTEDEINYLAMNILDKKYYEIQSNAVIDRAIGTMIEDILENIYEVYGLNFRNDLDIYTMLAKHMIPLRMRIAHGTNLKNPILEDIKEQYPFAFQIAKGLNPLLEKHLRQEINDDELSYLAIAIQLAFEKQRALHRRKKNVLIVCAAGNISSRLFERQFTDTFRDSVERCQICNLHELETCDFKEIDYVFATVPVNIKLPVPVYEVGEQLFDQGFQRKITSILNMPADRLSKAFSPCLFLSHIKASRKEDVLRLMCDQARLFRQVSDDFYELVIKREKMLNTCYGNRIALPHPYRTCSKETFICTCVLEESLLWNTASVRVVFLTAVSDDIHEDLERFYDDFFEFLCNKENIDRLIEEPTFENLIHLIKTRENK